MSPTGRTRSGAIQSITQYDAWGNEQVVSGTVSDPFGYNAASGYYLDRETGLYLCQNRFYDPAQGRWLNRDPSGFDGGTNLYGYCAGAPVINQDPEGLYHVIITLVDGLAIAKVYADPDDPIGIDDSGKPIRSPRGGELVDTFPVSNFPLGRHKPFPVGTWHPTGIGHGRGMGPNWLQFQDPNEMGPGSPGERGTWIHSGYGDNYKMPTNGCIRGREKDVNRLTRFYWIQQHYNKRVRMRVTVWRAS